MGELNTGIVGGEAMVYGIGDPIGTQAIFVLVESMLSEGANSGWVAMQAHENASLQDNVKLIPGESLSELKFSPPSGNGEKPQIPFCVARILIQEEMFFLKSIFGDWLDSDSPYVTVAKEGIEKLLLSILIEPVYEIT